MSSLPAPLPTGDTLALLARARADLAVVRTPGDAATFVRRAEAIAYLARKARAGLEVQNDAAELRLRAMRRAGELFGRPNPRGGARSRGITTRGNARPEGVSQQDESRWQAIFWDLPDPKFEQYITGSRARGQELSLRRLERIAREAAAGARNAAFEGEPLPAEIDLRECDLRALEIEPGSVDLILTDPPYPEEYLPEWGALGELAMRALDAGGQLVAYSGQMHLPACMAALTDAGLVQRWCGWVRTPGPATQIHARRIRSRGKPVLLYTKPPPLLLDRGALDTTHWGAWLDDEYESEALSKDDHPWQQGLAPAVRLIEQLTAPGALVLDPFLGSGTTALAAVSIGRDFVGCDIDPVAVATTRRRLAEGLREFA